MGLGAGQRNLSTAFVVAASNFSDRPDVIIALTVMSIIDLVLLLPLAGEIGKRVAGGDGAQPSGAQPVTTARRDSRIACKDQQVHRNQVFHSKEFSHAPCTT